MFESRCNSVASCGNSALSTTSMLAGLVLYQQSSPPVLLVDVAKGAAQVYGWLALQQWKKQNIPNLANPKSCPSFGAKSGSDSALVLESIGVNCACIATPVWCNFETTRRH
eukprot:6056606-Amphidinium_carterae.1